MAETSKSLLVGKRYKFLNFQSCTIMVTGFDKTSSEQYPHYASSYLYWRAKLKILLLNEEVLDQPSARYFGVHIDRRLTWKTHCEAKRKEFRSMYWLLRGCNKLNLASKRLLYVTVLRPIWSWDIAAWSYWAKTNVKMLQVQQNTILRKLVGAQ